MAVAERALLADVPSGVPAGHLPSSPERAAAGTALDTPSQPVQAAPAAVRLATGRAALPRLLADEADFGTPFLLAPVFIGIGALVYFTLPQEPGLALIGGGWCAAAATAWLARRQQTARIALLAMLCVATGLLAGKLETLRFATPMMGSEVSTRITGRLVHAERLSGGRTRLWVDVMATEKPVLKFPPARVRLSARGDHSDIPAGSIIAGGVKLFALPGPLRPGGYDFAFDAYFDGNGAGGFFYGKPELVETPSSISLRERLDRARAALTRRITNAVDGETGAIVAALVTGVRGAVNEADNEALRRSGLAHILSISGLHLALVCGAVLAVIRLGFAMVPVFAERHPAHKLAAGAAIIVGVLYGLLSGFEIATQRSTIMIAIMLLAVLAGRPAVTMRNLALAAILLLLIYPHEIMGPSFQMSFAATAALIGIYRLWSSRERAEPDRSGGPVRRLARMAVAATVATAVTSTAAGFATLPFGAFHFERLAPWSTAANLIAFPAVSLLVMPALLLGVAALPFGLDGWAWRLAGKGVEIVMQVARTVSEWGGPDATGPVTGVSLGFAVAALLLLCLPATRLRWLAMPPALAAIVSFAVAERPVALIAEDARLVAVLTESGALAVNRRKPDDFTLTDWRRHTRANAVLKPINADTSQAETSEGFVCDGDLCRVRLPGGVMLAHAAGVAAISAACETADIVILAQAMPGARCTGDVTVITAGMLARQGTAVLHAAQEQAGAKAAARRKGGAGNAILRGRAKGPETAAGHRITWTYPQAERPWQTHRRFSRAARDMEPYRPKPKPAEPGTAVPEAQ